MDKSAGIEIENIPTGVTRKDLVTLFKKELKDENEIKYILFPLQENRHSAFVCFKQSPDKAFIERLVAHNPLWHISLDTRMQTYCCCSAEVDALIVATIPDIPACIAMLEKDYGIEASYDDDSGKFVLKGMMHQLQCAQVRLDDIFREQLALQKMQLLQIGRSNETGVKKTWSDDSEEREIRSGTMSPTAGKDCLLESSKDVVEDQFEDRRANRERNRFSADSEYRSLPATSSLYERDFGLRRSRFYENEPQSYTSDDRTRFLSSFKHDRSNRVDEPVPLTRYSDASKRPEEDLLWTGDHRVNLQSDARGRTGHHSGPEYTPKKDSYISHNRKPYTSVADETEDKLTSNEPRNTSWRRDRVYTEGQSSYHEAYQPTYNFRSRVSPPSDLVPSRESENSRFSSDVAGRRMRSLSSEQPDGREDADAKWESRMKSDFWSERRAIDLDVPHSLPVDVPEVISTRRDHQPSKAQGRRSFSQDELSTAKGRQEYLTKERVDEPKDFHKVLDEPITASSEDERTLFLEPHVVRYILAVEKVSVENIKQRYKVGIKVSREPGDDFSMVVFTGQDGRRPDGQRSDHVERASKRFAMLYEETFNVIIQREVSINVDLPEVADVVECIRKTCRVIVVTDVPGTVTLVGEFRDVMKAVDMLNVAQSEIEAGDHQHGSGNSDVWSCIRQSGAGKDIRLEDTSPERRNLEKVSVAPAAKGSGLAKWSSKSQKSESPVARSLREMDDDFSKVGDVSESRSSAFVSMLDANRYTMTFRENFSVFIYTGDITKLRVDAIVNAANSFLRNYSGVAGAIEDAGGPEFRKDCEDFYLSHGPLKVSEVVHTAATGDLRCCNVIHTVGPQWHFESDEDQCAATLHTTFRNVLNYADETLEAESVALPAVGTGIYGVPVDLCARAIYQAVCSFLERSSSSSPTLKAVHVVNKDPGTTELIQAVFEGLRQLELERVKSRHSRSPTGKEGLSEISDNVAARRPCSERKLLDSKSHRKDEKSGRDQTQSAIKERNRKSGSYSGSDSESHVNRQGVKNTEDTGPTKGADATVKKGFFPISDTDSDEF